MLQQIVHLVRRARRIAPVQPFIGQTAQPIRGSFIFRNLGRIFVAQLVQREFQALRKGKSTLNRPFKATKEPAHLCLGSQTRFSVRQGIATQIIHTAAQSDSGDNIRQLATAAAMHQRRGTCHSGQAKAARLFCQSGEPIRIAPVVLRRQADMELPGKAARQLSRCLHPITRAALHRQHLWPQDQLQPSATLQKIRKLQIALTFFNPEPAH